jgi:3-isopropylmalate dehydrogenase
MKATIVLLPGDGIGPEVTAAARTVLERVARSGGHSLTFDEALIGGAAIDAAGTALPDDTLRRCEEADALLLGAVGGPKWSDPTALVRPEQGILKLRAHFGLFANLRPVPVFPALRELAPLRPELLEGVDLLVVRELTGGIYFGERHEQGDGDRAWDTMLYSVPEVERIAHVAFRAARGRRRRVTSVDKANVLASMRLWRRAVERVAREYPDVELRHHLVDSCAMQIMRTPAEFDVLLAGNMFGDILSDEASILAGSLGMLPSASLGEGRFGLYEPVHGSAPDIAGRGVANPLGAILSAAMLLRHSFGLDQEATRIEGAVSRALGDGLRTADLCRPSDSGASTDEMTEAVLARLDE